MNYATSYFIVPAAGLRSGQTLVVARPAGIAAADVSTITAHKIAVVGSVFSSPTDFTVANGADNTTVTWLSATTLPAGEDGILTLALAARDIDFIGEVDINGGTIDGASAGVTTKLTAVHAAQFTSSSTGGTTQIVYSGADSVSKSMFWLRARLTGAVTAAEADFGGVVCPMKIRVVDDCSSTAEQLVGMRVQMTSGGVYATGAEQGRTAFEASLITNGVLGDSGYLAQVAINGRSQVSVNLGGAGGWSSGAPNPPDDYYRGGVFGGFFQAQAYGTNLGGNTGAEINWTIGSAGSAARNIGLVLVAADDHAKQGEVTDAAITIESKNNVLTGTGTAIRNGIQFGVATSWWPFDSNSTLINTFGRGKGITAVNPKETTLSVYRGIDFEQVSAADAVFISPGFRVDPDGDTRVKSVELGTGGPTWTSGTGSPEGVVTAPVGSLYSRTDGGAGTTLYVKQSGTGNTGWAAK